MSNEFDAAVAATIQPDQGQAARVGFLVAADTNPDAYAEAQRVARRTGVPVDTVLNMPKEMKKQDTMGTIDFDALAKTAPATASLLADVERAKIAHDNLPSMIAIERSFLGNITEPVQRGLAQGRRGLTLLFDQMGIFKGLERQQAAAAAAHGISYDPSIELAVRLAQQQREVERYPVPDDITQGMRDISNAQTMGDAFTAIRTNPRAVLETTLQSLGASAPSLVGAAGGSVFGPGGTAAGAGIGSFAVEYSNTLQDVMAEKGVNGTDSMSIHAALNNPELMAAARDKALKRGIPVAIFDALTAALAGKLLAGAKPTVGSVAARAAGELGLQAGGGAAGEAGAQLATGDYKPGDILMEAFAEMPTAIIEVPGNYRHAMESAQRAQKGAEFIDNLNKMVQADKLVARDPQTFEQFVAQAAEAGPVQQVFIDARTLMQSGVAEQVAAVSPAVAAQIDAAVASGGQIAIPVEEYAARIAPTEYAKSLLDHLKVEPEGFSRAEAQEFMQNHAEELKAEVERILAEKQVDDTFKASAEAVRDEIRTQLDTVARFTPKVNASYASLVSNFYAVMAVKLGTTPEELFKRYPLKISAERIDGRQFEQSEKLREVDVFGDGSRVDYYDDKKGLMYSAQRTPTGVRWTVFETFPIEEGGDQVLGEMFKYKTLEEARAAVRRLRISATHKAKNAAKYGAIPNLWTGEAKKIAKALIDAGVGIERFASSTQSRSKYIYLASGLKVRLSDHALPSAYDPPDFDYRYGGDIKSLIEKIKAAESESEAGSEGLLAQKVGADNTARGSFNPASLSITLFKNADLSTFLHESGHFFLEMQFDIASKLQHKAEIFGMDTIKPGERQILNDTDALLRWFGVRNLAEWYNLDFEKKRAYHEQFARGFEAYLFEGKAPSIELQGLFQRFRAWLLNVYRDLKALNVELTHEVRGVFDRMLATDEQITLAEQGRSMMPLFTSPEQAGMTPEEFAAYQALGVDATNDAIQNLQARGLRDMRWLHNARGRIIKQLQKDAKAKRAEMLIEVRREVMSQPIYQAWQFLTGKLTADMETQAGDKVVNPQALGAGRLDLGELKAMGLPAEVINTVQARRMTASNGLHPDIVAEMFGFTSGDELVRKLAEVETPRAKIEALTDVRMLEQYGDLASPEAIEKAADKAIHNDVRARFVAIEANALARATGQRRILASAAKEFANAMVSRLKVRNIKPGQYANAEVRAAKAAERARKSGDLATAAAEKRNQLIQNYATRAAYDALEEVDKGLRYLKKFNGDIKNLDADYADQISNLLERFDLRKGQSNKAVDKRTTLAEWIKAQREAGLEPDIPPELENEAFRTSYKNLTVEEFRGLVDTVRQIEHLGRLKHKLLTAADQRAYEAVRDEIAGSIRAHGGKPKPANIEEPGRARKIYDGFMASNRKLSSLARQMDGGVENGPLYRYLIAPMNERGTWEAARLEQATETLTKLYAPILALPGGITGAKQQIPGTNQSLTRGGRLALALNWGNKQNRERILMSNWGAGTLTEQQVMAVISSLSREELEFVNGVHEFIDSFWPEIVAKERRIFGKVPEKVEALPYRVTLANGETVEMRGGYYPIKYDTTKDDKAAAYDIAEAAKDVMRGAFTASSTRRGHLKARVEKVKRPVRLSLDVITEHISQVIHDLAWHEWLLDANRLLSSKTISGAIRDYYGDAVLKTMRNALFGIAGTELAAQDATDHVLRHLRANVSAATMGWSVATAMLQPFGILQSVHRIGAKYVLRGMARWVGDAARFENTVAWIAEKSDFMRLRNKTFNRELFEIQGRVSHGKGKARQVYEASLFMLAQKMQMIADVPTWVGAYEKALEQGLAESDAIALADRAVLEAQGGGQTKDLTEFQRRHPMLAVFYSYFSTTYNLVVESTARTDWRKPLSVGAWMGDMVLLVVIPALGPALVMSLLRGDGEDDPEKWIKRLAKWQAAYLFGLLPGLRELSGVVEGYNYAGPPVGRIVGDIGNVMVQLTQGEVDEGLALASARLSGTLLGVPVTQLIRSYRGWKAWANGDAPPTSVLLGPPSKD